MGDPTAADPPEMAAGSGTPAADPPETAAGAGAPPGVPAGAPAPGATPSTRPGGRLAVIVGAAALGLVAVGFAWVVITGLLARAQLQRVRDELPQLRRAVLAGQLDDARVLAERVTEHAQRAHSLTTGPAWWVAANLPGVGSPLQTSRVIAASADRIGTDVVPTAVRLARVVSQARPQDASIDLSSIEELAPQLHRAARVVDRVSRQVAASAPSWLESVSSARASVVDQLERLDGELSGADRAVQVALPMLGATRPQRYFIGFLNDAEARGLGGIPGAFAIVTTYHGRVSFDHFGTDAELGRARAKVDLGAEFERRYRQDDPTGNFPNSDVSPDFRDAARIWAGMWAAKTGQRIDGALAVDPTALSYLLAVTGPAQLPDGSPVSAGNVVALTQQEQYVRFQAADAQQNAARKRYLVAVARAVSERLTAGGDAHRLVRAVSRAAAERRLLVWSAQPGVELKLVAAGWAGALGAPAGTPHTGFVVVNAAGSKLDYYLERSMAYRCRGCGAGARATATLRLTNAAPTHGLPPYVTIRVDDAATQARPGDNRLLVTYYGSEAARIVAVTVNGRPMNAVRGTENGLTTATLDLELPAGRTRVVRVQVAEPAATAPVQVLRQPLVRPMPVTVDAPRCAG